jgi:hypothetical protein
MTSDLRNAALGLGDRLPALVVATAELRDESVAAGNTSRARFYSELAIFLAQVRDDYFAAIRAMETDVADSYVAIAPDEGEQTGQ